MSLASFSGMLHTRWGHCVGFSNLVSYTELVHNILILADTDQLLIGNIIEGSE